MAIRQSLKKNEFAYTPEAFLAAFEEWIAAMELAHFTLVVQGFFRLGRLAVCSKTP